MSYKLSRISRKDRAPVYVGSCHNIGAGGVDKHCGVDMVMMSDKRFKQFCHRTDRATGVVR